MNERDVFVHPIEPVFDRDSEILILGSFPSVHSREEGFYYAHRQNRFWRLLALLWGEEVPGSISDKIDFLHRHHIALHDVLYSCSVTGSGDASIRKAMPADLLPILRQSKIKRVYCNGQTAGKYYRLFHQKRLGIKAIILPSTSPANASCSLQDLENAWRVLLDP